MTGIKRTGRETMDALFTLNNSLSKHNFATCECFEDRIVLTTQCTGGVSQYYTNRTRTIPIADISSVIVARSPSYFWSMQSGFAYIQFHAKGSHEASPDDLCGERDNKGLKKLIDSGAMLITRQSKEEQLHIAHKIRDYIESKIELMDNEDTQGNTADDNSGFDPVNEILRYKKLLDDGVISPEEFDAAKRLILNM